MSGRVDPYYTGIWADGATASWLSRSLADRQVQAGLGHLPRVLAADPGAALTRLFTGAQRPRTLAALGVIDSWRTATTQQVAAITGRPELANPDARTWTDLFAAGLVERGVPTAGLLAGDGRLTGRDVVLVRPARTRTFDRDVAPHLTYPELVAVTGGLPWSTNRQADRHNVLSVELGLRMAGLPGIRAVIGERWASHELLGFTALGVEAPKQWKFSGGDLVAIRDDGLRIVIELTASGSPRLDAKAERWARLLSMRSLRESGLVVIFVDASTPERRASAGLTVLAAVRDVVATAVRRVPGTRTDPTAARIGVTSWSDWFALSGPTAAFNALQATFATGPEGDRWRRTELADRAVELDGSLRHAATGAACLAGTIQPGRPAPGPPIWDVAVHATGLNPRDLISAPARSDRPHRSRPGAARGSAGTVLPPASLVDPLARRP